MTKTKEVFVSPDDIAAAYNKAIAEGGVSEAVICIPRSIFNECGDVLKQNKLLLDEVLSYRAKELGSRGARSELIIENDLTD